jgi:hypothetical protein
MLKNLEHNVLIGMQQKIFVQAVKMIADIFQPLSDLSPPFHHLILVQTLFPKPWFMLQD